jgi:transglutaminase-like putative cysteine protease
MEVCMKSLLRKWLVFSLILMVFTSVPLKAFAQVDTKNKQSYQELKAIIYQHLTNREPYFEITFMGPGRIDKTKSFVEQAFREIYNNDKYLLHSIKAYVVGGAVYKDRIIIGFKMEYHTTKEQEAFVDSRVKQIVKAIIKPGMNDHEKVKAIHDYIVSHVEYDNSLKEFSAYAALTKGKTVCNGYALLANKMLKEAQIDNRIVSGYAVNTTGKPEPHAWNLVKIEGKWYHVDCTWDDLGKGNQVFYPYYALSDSEIKHNHQWVPDMVPKASLLYIKELEIKKGKDSNRKDFYNSLIINIARDISYRNTGYRFNW